jgi:hypothetical protein
LKPTIAVRGKLLSILALVICLVSGNIGLPETDDNCALQRDTSRGNAVGAPGQRGVNLSAREPNRQRSGISSPKKVSKAIAAQKIASTVLSASGALLITSSLRHGAAQVFTGFGRSPPALNI